MEALAIGSAVAGAAGTVMQGQMQAAGAEHQAQQAEFQQQTAEINATQSNAYYTDRLRKTFSTIDAMRAGAGMGDSPTSIAYKAEQARINEQQRSSAVLGNEAQAKQSQADAAFYSAAASDYTTLSYVNAAAGFGKSMSQSPGVSSFLAGGW